LGEDAWRKYAYLWPYLDGAQRRAKELGFRLEEVWTKEPGMTAKRLSTILYSRGIEGVIVTQYLRHLRLDWNRFAAVTLHGQLVSPSLPHVTADLSHNLFTAVKKLHRLGYRKIGICLEATLKNYAFVTLKPVAKYLAETFAPTSRERVPPLFYPWGWGTDKRRDDGVEVIAWIKKYRPDAIVCHSSMLLGWIERAGFSVPGEIALVHLATDDDVSDWAGIDSHRRTIGGIAVEQVVARVQHRQFGLPAVSQDTLVRGEWHGGWTVAKGAKDRRLNIK
jgi:LacI family transcriptional regulator